MDRPLNETDVRKLDASLAVIEEAGLKLSDADVRKLEESLAIIEEAGLKLSDALATLTHTHRSIKAILRPPEPESGKRWQ